MDEIPRGESEIYGENENLLWAYFLVSFLVVSFVIGFIYAILK